MLNHEFTVINYIFWKATQIHWPHPGPITARPVQSGNHLNGTCVTEEAVQRNTSYHNLKNRGGTIVTDIYLSTKPFLSLWDCSEPQ